MCETSQDSGAFEGSKVIQGYDDFDRWSGSLGAPVRIGRAGHTDKYYRYRWNGSANERDRILGRQHSIIFAAFKLFPDSTDREVFEKVLEKKYRSTDIASRRREMVLMGFIECGGRRHCTVTGILSKVWHVTMPTKE